MALPAPKSASGAGLVAHNIGAVIGVVVVVLMVLGMVYFMVFAAFFACVGGMVKASNRTRRRGMW